MLALVPCLFWTGGTDTAPALRRAGIEQFCSPPTMLERWKQLGFSVTPMTEDAFRARTRLISPGIDRKVFVASATTAPWVNANGWKIRREPKGSYCYDLPGGAAALAAAEAFAYGADAVLRVQTVDLGVFGAMLRQIRSVPLKTLPEIADYDFVDDGSARAGEILNLLTRRNLLYRIVKGSRPDFKPDENPHVFAAKVRERITDEKRSLRVYGSEVVICRLLGNDSQARIHLLNYGGTKLEAVRLRVRGAYRQATGAAITELTAVDGFTEFTVRNLDVYAVVDLQR